MKQYIITILLLGIGRVVFGQCNPPAITPVDTIICSNDSAMLCAPSGYRSYAWNFGDTSSCIFANAAGNYWVTVTDNNNCTVVSNNAVVSVYPVCSVGIVVSNNVYSFYSDCVFTDSLHWVFDGQILPWATFDNFIPCQSGTYALATTDTNGCREISSPIYLSYEFNPSVALALQYQVCDGDSVVLNPLVSDSLGGPYSYVWSSPQSLSCYNCPDPELTVTQNSIVTLTVTDPWGDTTRCSSAIIEVTTCDSLCVGCVWPGDANNDGIVDNNDLLAIGLAYDSSGPVRPNASANWIGQTCPDWADTLLSGANYKFVDCNGDGIVDADDTLAVDLNFQLTHVRSGEIRSWRSGEPVLSVSLSPDTLSNGEPVTAAFSLGSLSLPATNIYGIAFTYNYDPRVVDPAQTQISFGNSWMGTDTTKISLARDFPAEGKMEIALTGIDHVTRSGNGPIGLAQFVITTDNINGKDLLYYSMQTWISDLKVIDNKGNELNFNEGGDTATISYYPAGISEINSGASIKIFPNPAHDQLIIQSQNQLAMQEITLFDLLGETILTQPVTQLYKTTVDVSSLSSGAYFIQVKTAGGTAMKRFVVAR